MLFGWAFSFQGQLYAKRRQERVYFSANPGEQGSFADRIAFRTIEGKNYDR